MRRMEILNPLTDVSSACSVASSVLDEDQGPGIPAVSMATTQTGDTCTIGDICTIVAQHDRDLRILAKVGELLATQSGQRQMLAAVLDELERQLGMTRGTIMLLSSDGSELFVEMARDIASERQDLRYRRGEGIIGNVFETGEAAIIPRILQEPRFTNRIHQRGQAENDDASFLCVPIRLGSEVVGTLSVDLPLLEPATLSGAFAIVGNRGQHDRLRRQVPPD